MYGLRIQEGYRNEIQNQLVWRLDQLLYDIHHLIDDVECMTIRGNCNEIELILVENFGFTLEQIRLIEQKSYQFWKYNRGKYGGYVLTTDKSGEHIWTKNGKVVKPSFREPDNGIGDKDAIEAVKEFQIWLKESGITHMDWMIDADVICPAITEAEEYVLD